MIELPRTRPLVIGHRGASGYRPEHTESAYTLAFALGADAVEPDVVLTRDEVPVVRHENEISGTTDVADHPEFAGRRTTKEIDGRAQTGWFTEDFTWSELQSLRARERLPAVRPASASFDGRFGLLRLSDVLRIADDARSETAATAGGTAPFDEGAGQASGPSVVVEVKHATYFESLGLPLGEIVAAELAGAGWSDRPGDLVVESFEKTVLLQLKERGLAAHYTYLVEDAGAPFDVVARDGSAAPDYASHLTDAGLAALTGQVDGISVDKSILMPRDLAGAAHRSTDLVARAHRAGLSVFVWTLRAENRFLPRNFRVGHDKAAFGQWEHEFRAILATGVDGVFADQPDLAVAARGAVGGAA